MTSIMRDLLLIANPKVLNLAEYLNRSALLFILPCFYIAMAWEYFNNWDFQGIIKRSMIAFLAIKLLTPLHIVSVDISLELSSALVTKYSPQNKFLTAYRKAKSDKNVGVWKKLSTIVEIIIDDPIVLIIFLLSYIAFFLLTQLYSLVYHLGIVMIGFCAVLSIFPMTSRSLVGAVKTNMWCVLMPFVVAIVLCLIGDSDAFFKTYSGGIVQNLESLIQLLIMTVILLMTPSITSKIMSEAGVSQVAENLGQMAATGALIGGGALIASQFKSKSGAIASGLHNLTTKPLINSGKAKLGNKASGIADNKSLAPKIKSFGKADGLKEMVSEKSNLAGNAISRTSLGEKMVLGADSLVNREENKLARAARAKDAKAVSQNPKLNTHLLPLSDYKREAREFLTDKKQQGRFGETSQQKENRFLDFHEGKGKYQSYSHKPNREEAFVFSKDKWKKLGPELQNMASKKFGIGKKIQGTDGMVYFPLNSQKRPVPIAIYNRSRKPTELKHEKHHI